MAVKMVNESDLISIADAIRAKTGGTATLLYPEEFVSEIGSISGGSVDVDAFLDGTLTELESNATSVRDYAFIGLTQLSSLSLPECLTLGSYSCAGIGTYDSYTKTEVYAPKVTTVGTYCFNTAKLSTLTLTAATTLNQGCFQRLSADNIIMPALTSVPENVFTTASGVKRIELTACSMIASGAFKGMSNLGTLIIHGTQMCYLMGTDTFNNTQIKYGTGFIYVPDEMVSTYQAATNWTALSAQIKGLSELQS